MTKITEKLSRRALIGRSAAVLAAASATPILAAGAPIGAASEDPILGALEAVYRAFREVEASIEAAGVIEDSLDDISPALRRRHHGLG
jgi:hypothetical protein